MFPETTKRQWVTFPVSHEEYDGLAALVREKPKSATRVTEDYEKVLGASDYRVGIILFAHHMKVSVDINPPEKAITT